MGPAETIDSSVKSATAPVGTKVRYFGDYELLEEIARGGMGVVYKARQISLNRTVALKMILAGQLADEEAVKRFHSEAEAAAKLDHPGIVPIYEVGEHEGQHYFSMGFVDGQSLAARLADGPLPPKEAAELSRKIAEAVAYAHQQGVIHRDLKPANVLIDASGQPRITDFGLAKRTDVDRELTATGQILGTPGYMPPEQALGELDRIGETSDVYSLGAVLFCLLTGRPPFQAAKVMDTLMQVIEKEPIPPRQLDGSIPIDLDTICLKCLDKEPMRRYPTAQELADELQRFIDGKPVRARPLGRPARTWRWCKRNPVVASLSAIVLLILIVGVTVSSAMAIIAQRNAAMYRAERDRADEQADAARAERTRADQQADTARAARNRADREAEAARIQEARATEEAENAKAQTYLAQRRLYGSQIQLADRAWQDADIDLMNELLSATVPEFRGWEYGHLQWRLHSRHKTLRGHAGSVFGVAISPDGKRIVSASSDETVKVWDVETGEEAFTLQGHMNGVDSAAFSADGQRIVSGGWRGAIKVWDAETGQEILSVPGHTQRVLSVTFSPDGQRIVSAGGDHILKVWDAETGKEIFTLLGHSAGVNGVAISADGKRIVSASEDKTLKVWDAKTGQEIRTLHGHTQGVLGVTFSPGGKRIVSASWEKTLKVWDAETGQEIRTLRGHSAGVTCVAISSDGQRIVSGSDDKTLKIWDAETGEEMFTLRGHSQRVHSVAVSRDGRRVVSGSHDTTLKVWHAEFGQEVRTLHGHSQSVLGVAISPDGRRIVSGSEDKTLKIWDAETGQEIRTLRGHTQGVLSVTFSPDGQRIVSLGEDWTLKVWDAGTGQEILTLDRTSLASSAVFSPDGNRIAAGTEIWDAETGRKILTFDERPNAGTAAAFSPDGKRIVSGEEVRDAETGQKLLTLSIDYQAPRRGRRPGPPLELIISVAFSADGQRIVSGQKDNSGQTVEKYNTVKIWDAKTGHHVLTLRGHSATVNGVATSPDGQRIVSGSDDGTVKVWDAMSAQEILTLHGHSRPVFSVAISPDGQRIVSGSGDLTVKVWDAKTARLPVSPEPYKGPPLAVAPFDAENAKKHQQVSADYLGVAVEVTNSIGMKLVLIPPGEFFMGSPESEEGREGDEEFQHRVRITKPFYLGAYEVTQAEYERVMGTNPSHFSATGSVTGGRSVRGQDTRRFPVEQVSWYDAVQFCRKLSALPAEESAGLVYRLPTEAEWEFACRAGTTTRFCGGDSGSQLVDYAWYVDESPKSPVHPVGQKKPNAFALYDMHGHVWEWCQDWFGDSYFKESPLADPQGPQQSYVRVIRGGSWANGREVGNFRSAHRGWDDPVNRVNLTGFRVAAVAAGK